MTNQARRPRTGRILAACAIAMTMAIGAGCQSDREGTGRTAGQVTDDFAIQTAVVSRLLADKQVSGMKIQTQVYKGVVTLFGRVPDESTRARALKIASEVKGVSEVDDRLTIVPE